MTEHIKAEWYGNEHELPDGSYIDKYGDVCHVKNGKRHREDGPATEWAGGSKFWHINGKKHRDDGPAAEWSHGVKEWWVNDKRHREDGPAIEHNDGTKLWYKNGKQHRENGPAVEWFNGIKEWWVDDKVFLTEEEYLEAIKVWKMNEAMK